MTTPDSSSGCNRPIPENDIRIATHVLEAGADLVSYDRHFDRIDGLALVYLPAE